MPAAGMNRWALRLRKWCLDGVSTEGDVCIGYQATLQLGPLNTGYRGLLLRNAQGQEQDRSAWGSGRAPSGDASSGWQWSEWMTGEWQPQIQGMTSVLWDGPGVHIQWNCLSPLCQTRVKSVCAGNPVDWLMQGYLECMDLSLASLSLPLRSLRWGRAIAAGHSVVWIDWDDGKTLTKVWLDGVPTPARLEGEGPDRLLGSGWQLVLKPHAVLRHRELGNVLPDLIRDQFGVLANSHEVKWLGRANIGGLDADATDGWAIYERVVWT